MTSNVLVQLLTSKRFIITTLAAGGAVTLAALGKIPVAQVTQEVTILAAVLTAAYGLENAAAAHGASFPDPPDTTTTQVTNTATVATPAETPAAKKV